MEKGIKAKGKVEKVSFDSYGLVFIKKSVIYHSLGLGLYSRVEDFTFLQILDFKFM